jgi:hypothetical protein
MNGGSHELFAGNTTQSQPHADEQTNCHGGTTHQERQDEDAK